MHTGKDMSRVVLYLLYRHLMIELSGSGEPLVKKWVILRTIFMSLRSILFIKVTYY